MEIMKPYRRRIDEIDDRIVDLLAARTDIIREVAVFKAENGIPAVLQDRVDEVIARTAARARAKNLDPALVEKLYDILVSYSCGLEEAMMTPQHRKTGR